MRIPIFIFAVCCFTFLNGCDNSDDSAPKKNLAKNKPQTTSPVAKDDPTSSEKEKSPGTKVVVEKATLSFDGKSIPRKPSLEDLEKMFGKPDRHSDLANVIYTWDKLGIIAYRKPKEELIHCLAIFFSKPEHKYEPAEPFAGLIEFGKHTFDARSDASQLEKAGFTSPSYAPFLHSIEKPSCSIFSEISENRNSFSYTWK